MNNETFPDFDPSELFELAEVSTPKFDTITRKEYKNGIKSISQQHGNTITEFPDGGIHFDFPKYLGRLPVYLKPCPVIYEDSHLDDVKENMPDDNTIHKKYADDLLVVVTKEDDGNVVLTLFPDGSSHKEYPDGSILFMPPKNHQ